jgi:hypothetical protein
MYVSLVMRQILYIHLNNNYMHCDPIWPILLYFRLKKRGKIERNGGPSERVARQRGHSHRAGALSLRQARQTFSEIP